MAKGMSMSTARVGLLGEAALRNGHLLAGPVAGSAIEIVALEGESDPRLATLDVLVSRTWPARADGLDRLRLLQLPSSGTESIRLDEVPARITICNATGHEQAMAEYIVSALTLLLRGLPAMQAEFRAGFDSVNHRAAWQYTRETGASTVAILGAGGIARATAGLLRAYGAAVRVCSRHAPEAELPPGVRWYPAADLETLCEGADALVIACPLTPETEGSIGRELLARLNGGVLVNVSRARIVKGWDLVEALRTGRLSGGALDVWDGVDAALFRAFSELSAVLLTPHVSAWTLQTMQRRWLAIARNLIAFQANENLSNVVRAGASSIAAGRMTGPTRPDSMRAEAPARTRDHH